MLNALRFIIGGNSNMTLVWMVAKARESYVGDLGYQFCYFQFFKTRHVPEQVTSNR